MRHPPISTVLFKDIVAPTCPKNTSHLQTKTLPIFIQPAQGSSNLMWLKFVLQTHLKTIVPLGPWSWGHLLGPIKKVEARLLDGSTSNLTNCVTKRNKMQSELQNWQVLRSHLPSSTWFYLYVPGHLTKPVSSWSTALGSGPTTSSVGVGWSRLSAASMAAALNFLHQNHHTFFMLIAVLWFHDPPH